jgi:antitoxin component YwqK of YwqJK toxin-antitoxin module
VRIGNTLRIRYFFDYLSEKVNMKKKICELTKEELQSLIDSNTSINAILKQLNVNSNGSGAYKTFKNHCRRLQVSVPFYKNNGNAFIGPKISLNEILVENSTYQNGTRLKKRLVSEGVLEYKCTGKNCKVESEWNGISITLQLDHLNGIHNDNRIENIRFLCPNCHSQTLTFSGKNLVKRRDK